MTRLQNADTTAPAGGLSDIEAMIREQATPQPSAQMTFPTPLQNAHRAISFVVKSPLAETDRLESARTFSFRIFLKQCPECDGPVRVGQEVVESCRRSYDVVAASYMTN